MADERAQEVREIHLRDYLKVVAKRKITVATFFVIIFAVTLIVTFSATPVYIASTKVLIEKNEPANLGMMNYLYMPYDPNFAETQYQLIRSSSVSMRVVRMLSLDHPQAADEKAGEEVTNIFTGTLRWFRDLFSLAAHLGGKAPRPEGAASPEVTEKERQEKAMRLAKMISGSIIVTPVKNSNLVTVSYQSTDPEQAARIVNSVAQAYIEEVLEIKMSSSKYAMKWMTEKAEEERLRLEQSERALQEYMKNKDIVTLQDRLAIVPERLSEVASKLAGAETNRKEKETLYNQVKDLTRDMDKAQTMPSIASDPTVQSLRSQILKAEQNVSELSKKFGQKHPAMIAGQEELRGLREKRDDEIRRVISSIRNDFELAKASEENLRRLAGQTKAETLNLTEKFVQFGVLKREAETSKQLFDAIVKRIKEQGVTQDIQTVNVWVVEKAETPVSPAMPNKPKNILLGILVGLIGGIGLAFFVEYLDNTVKSPEETEARIDMPVLGMVELLKPGQHPIEGIIASNPRSPVAESYRLIRTALVLSSPDRPPKNILITSMSPAEGKSATAVNIAMTFAQSEKTVLLIDADLRKPRLHKLFQLENSQGLSTYLAGASGLTVHSPEIMPQLKVITSGPTPPNPSELIGSRRMKELLRELDARFDVIIWDSPPFLAVADSMLLSRILDGTLIIAKAGSTTYDALRRGAKSCADIGAHCLGIIVNCYDPKHSPYYYHSYNYSAADSDKTKTT